jgi:RNA polymerase-interacting CarD/CdnL/TRCF family regulator
MEFQIGDWVVHSTHGLGQILAIETRTINEIKSLYYMVKVASLTIWVPVDENVKSRLRLPNNAAGFLKSISVLSEPAESLSNDYRQRNLQLHEMLKDGGVEAYCKVIRDLAAYRQGRPASDHDNALMKYAQNILIGEWSFSLAITLDAAELELNRFITASVVV